MTSSNTQPSTAPAPSQPSQEEVSKAVEAARSAARLQTTADTLRTQAASIKDSAERERLWQAAYNKEVEARGESKKARLMASGWGQGAAGGIAASAALGMGLGNLVGALVSGVVAVPGVLVGAGVGALTGPAYDVKQNVERQLGVDGNGKGRKGKEEDEEEMHRMVVEAARAEDNEGKSSG